MKIQKKMKISNFFIIKNVKNLVLKHVLLREFENNANWSKHLLIIRCIVNKKESDFIPNRQPIK